ncbi:MAG: hypothetical protein LBM62_07420 [Mediterranea sp.]|jgi:hypothetical protein|nr:hypothetical protein [Mediterranea sp.]
MKKIILSLLACIAIMPLFAQEEAKNEPEFVGQVNLIQGEQVTPLERKYVKTENTEGKSIAGISVKSAKTKIELDGGKSPVRASESDNFHLIVRAPSNEADPITVINIFKLKDSKKKRKAAAELGTFGSNTEGLDLLNYTAKRYGKSSYLITLMEKPAGEYGIIVNNPDSKDKKRVLVSCFGIDL